MKTFIALVAATLVGTSSAQCTSNSAKVGFKGQFNTRNSYGVQGTVEIVDDCSFRVTGYTQTQAGPDVFFYAAAGNLNDPVMLTDASTENQIIGTFDNEDLGVFALRDGLSWDNFDILSVWCREFAVNFADLDLEDAPVVNTDAPTRSPVTPAPSSSPSVAPTFSPTSITCVDGVFTPESETDVDCGGDCPGCAVGLNCTTNDDCLSGNCGSGVCDTPMPSQSPTRAPSMSPTTSPSSAAVAPGTEDGDDDSAAPAQAGAAAGLVLGALVGRVLIM